MFQTLHTSKPNFAMTSQRLRPARHVLRSFTLAALFTAATPGPLFAQSDAQIREDIRFARGVAEEWGFVDLADGILADIEAGNVRSRRSAKGGAAGLPLGVFEPGLPPPDGGSTDGGGIEGGFNTAQAYAQVGKI